MKPPHEFPCFSQMGILGASSVLGYAVAGDPTAEPLSPTRVFSQNRIRTDGYGNGRHWLIAAGDPLQCRPQPPLLLGRDWMPQGKCSPLCRES